MSDPGNRQAPSDHLELDAELRAVAHFVAFPPTPDLWPDIERRLLPDPASDSMGRRWSWTPWLGPWRIAAVAVILLLALLVSLALVPDLGRAVADRLGLSGVVIRFIDEPPALPTAPAGAALDLGRPVSLDDAAADAGYPIKVPTLPALGSPESVYITYGAGNPMVSLVYAASDLLPASRFTGVGALLTQFEGSIERGFIAKGLLDETAIRLTDVNGATAYWIDGAAHTFMYLDPTGQIQSDTYRLAGNVLLWEVDGVTYRLESELPQETATVIAETMRPVSGTD